MAVIFWNKQPLARYLRGMLRDVPELLSDLDFYGEKKRETAGRLVDHLLHEEARDQAVTAFSASIQALRDQFLAMQPTRSSPQARGKAFEGFLNELLGLFDLTPRAACSLEREQIDGAFSFDTDDYILEARWWQEPIGREHLDVFKSKFAQAGR